MNYAIYTKVGKINSKSRQYVESVITLCGTPEVKASMVNQQEKMHNVLICTKFGRSLACYVEDGYGKPYKHLKG